MASKAHARLEQMIDAQRDALRQVRQHLALLGELSLPDAAELGLLHGSAVGFTDQANTLVDLVLKSDCAPELLGDAHELLFFCRDEERHIASMLRRGRLPG